MSESAPALPIHLRTSLAGRRLGRYEVLARLASGGMAGVYVARALGVAGFERLFAVKVLHPHLAHEQEFITMFLDEARLAARIRHPNVVPTIDISDTQDAGYYLVMEYIEGDHLGALLQQAYKLGTRLPPPIALRVIVDALEGLAAAHELTDESGRRINLVHRDVSPHNVMVGTDGIARITDFGVAKAEVRLSTTREGQFKGKLAYMAPEHASTGEADQRSDLFSAGDHPVGVPDRPAPVPRREPGRDAEQDLHRADPDAVVGRSRRSRRSTPCSQRALARDPDAALPDRGGVRRGDRGARRPLGRPRQPARGRASWCASTRPRRSSATAS